MARVKVSAFRIECFKHSLSLFFILFLEAKQVNDLVVLGVIPYLLGVIQRIRIEYWTRMH
jgi:hypothetical protein